MREREMEINRRAPLVARKEVLINASPEAVWRIQSDIDCWKSWETDISKSQLEGELKRDAVFKWTSGGFTVKSKIQEVVPQQRLAWSGKSVGSSAKHVWTFEPRDGGTLVTTEESMEGWLVTIIKAFAPDFLDKSLDKWTLNLKRKAEEADSG